MANCNETLIFLQKYRAENLLCVICRNLLDDSCQGQCRCLYCKKCFELYLKNDKICPGNSGKCKIEKMKIVENNSMYDEQFTVFLQWILQMNEYFSSLINNNIKPDETKNELKLIEKILYNFQRNFSLYKLNNENILENLLIAVKELRQHIKNHQIFGAKNVLNNDKKFNLQCSIEQNNIPKSLFNQPNLNISMKEGNYNSQEIARFNWDIDDFCEIRDKNRDVYSNSFLSIDGQYEMRLYFYPNGSDYHNDWQFGVRLWMEDGPTSLYRWPFIGYMTITLKKKSQKIFKSLTKKLSINTSLLNPCGRSKLFTFNYSDLYLSNDLENNSIIIECSIKS